MTVLYTYNGITRSGEFSLSRKRVVDTETRNENVLTATLTTAARLVCWSPEDFLSIKGQFAGRYRVEGMEHTADGRLIKSSIVREDRTERVI